MGKLGVNYVQQLFKANARRFDRVLDKLKIISAGDGHCMAELKIAEDHTNSKSVMHSSLGATLIDTVSSIGFLTYNNSNMSGVSVDLHASYIKDANIGDEIVIDSKTVKTGRSMAYLEVLISDKKSGELLIKGRQTLFLVGPKN